MRGSKVNISEDADDNLEVRNPPSQSLKNSDIKDEDYCN